MKPRSETSGASLFPSFRVGARRRFALEHRLTFAGDDRNGFGSRSNAPRGAAPSRHSRPNSRRDRSRPRKRRALLRDQSADPPGSGLTSDRELDLARRANKRGSCLVRAIDSSRDSGERSTSFFGDEHLELRGSNDPSAIVEVGRFSRRSRGFPSGEVLAILGHFACLGAVEFDVGSWGSAR